MTTFWKVLRRFWAPFPNREYWLKRISPPSEKIAICWVCHVFWRFFHFRKYIKLSTKCFFTLWWWWVVFVEWLTDERRLALFPAGTIGTESHHRKSPTHRKGFESALNCSSVFFEWSFAVVITTASLLYYCLLLDSSEITWNELKVMHKQHLSICFYLLVKADLIPAKLSLPTLRKISGHAQKCLLHVTTPKILFVLLEKVLFEKNLKIIKFATKWN